MLGCGDGKPCKGRVAPREGARAGLGGRLTTGPLGRRASSPPSPSAGSGCTSFLPDLPFFPLNCRGEARADVSPPPPSSRGTVGRCVSAGSRCGDAFARTGGGRCRGRAGLRSGAPSEPAAPPVVPRAPHPKLSPGEARGGGSVSRVRMRRAFARVRPCPGQARTQCQCAATACLPLGKHGEQLHAIYGPTAVGIAVVQNEMHVGCAAPNHGAAGWARKRGNRAPGPRG